MSRKGTPDTEYFWDLVEPLLAEPDIDEGSLMGFPCLRVHGDFFGTCDHRTGDLIVKVDRSRVAELIEAGVGQPFAPAGRVFKEWVLIEERDDDRWLALLGEAREFVAGS